MRQQFGGYLKPKTKKVGEEKCCPAKVKGLPPEAALFLRPLLDFVNGKRIVMHLQSKILAVIRV